MLKLKMRKKIIASMVSIETLMLFGCAFSPKLGSAPAYGLADTEKVFVDINGSTNGMFITSTDEKNPVLLFISGGPGVPEVWLNEAYSNQYPNKIAEYFTVCYWDYFGEGLSFNSSINTDEITIERLSADAHEVAQYLKNRFGKEKIYLMAHSSGTNLGIHLAQTNSTDFYCYFGMGQDYVGTKSLCRYEEGYHFMKKIFEESGNNSGISKMKRLVSVENGEFKIKKPDTIGADWEKVLLEAGCATTREMRSDVKDIFLKHISCKCYTLSEKINYWKGKVLCSKSLYADYEIDAEKPAVIPVCFLSGYYDYTTPITLSKELFEKLEAPEKSFYTFNKSAHSPLWEENNLVIEAMLKYVR